MTANELLDQLKRTGIAVFLLAASAAKAQSGVLLERVDVTGRIDRPGLLLDEPSSVGSRTGLSGRELPASVEAISARTIRERGDFLVRDAITRTTGLTDIASPGDGGMSFSARGFTGVNSVGLAEDGIRLAVAAGTQTYPSDSWGYERIEVLRGPASVVFGNGTVGATINAVRKAPRREGYVEGLAGVGDHGTGRVGLGATGPLGENLSYRIDAYASTTDGIRDLGRARGYKLMTTLRFDPREDLRFELLADYSRQDPDRYFGTPLVDGRIDKSLRDENYNVQDSIIRYEDKRLRGRVQWQITPNVVVSDELYVLKADRHWRNVEEYILDPATRRVTRDSYLEILHEQRQSGNRAEMGYNLGNHRAVAGWEVGSIAFTHINNSPFGGLSTVPDRSFDHGTWASRDPTLPMFSTDTRMQAVYLEDAVKLDERWLLLAGIRYDTVRVERTNLVTRAAFERKLSGTSLRAGLTYKVDSDTNVYAQASSGKDPVTSLVTLNLANADFKLTSGWQVEAGIKQRLPNDMGDWTAAVYRIDKRDIITSDPNNPAIAVQGGKQHSQGIELGASVAPASQWRIEGNIAALQARFDELVDSSGASQAGNRPPDVPELTANLWGHYMFGPWQMSLGARYVGKRFGDNANTLELPAYTVVDAAVSYRFDRSALLRALVRNLGDKTYAIATYGPTQAVLGERRHFEIRVEFAF